MNQQGTCFFLFFATRRDSCFISSLAKVKCVCSQPTTPKRCSAETKRYIKSAAQMENNQECVNKRVLKEETTATSITRTTDNYTSMDSNVHQISTPVIQVSF